MRHNTSAQSKRKGWHSSSSYLSPTSTVSGNIDANDRSRHLTSGFAFQNVSTHGELATDYEARAVFFAGIAPALITLWIQRSVHEPEAWKREIRVEKSETRRLFQGTLGYGVLICASMNAAALFTDFDGRQPVIPELVEASVTTSDNCEIPEVVATGLPGNTRTWCDWVPEPNATESQIDQK